MRKTQMPNIIGVGIAPSMGLRKGQIIDVEETISNITASLEDAERMAENRYIMFLSAFPEII